MISYFDRVEQGMCDVVERRARRPWYVRMLSVGRTRPLVVLIVGLVVATPAVGAVTNWFGIGAPNHPPSEAQPFGVGNAIPGTTKLLGLRVPDPQGGPPWGIRVVSTQTGACEEIGRVEDGQLGSLGIDHYWNDDQLFHPYPKNWVGQMCGSSGNTPGSVALGSGAGEWDESANRSTFRNGIQLTGCTTGANGPADRPPCPPGSLRLVIFGQLGSNVRSITYQQPNRSLATEQTAGKYGAYLLVFQVNINTCRLYMQGQLTSSGWCLRGMAPKGAFLSPITEAIKEITHRNGQICRVTGPGLGSAGCQPRHRAKHRRRNAIVGR
jgi:hypothetical protein